MQLDHAHPILRYEEAERVAERFARNWIGLTGLTDVPSVHTITDMVLTGQRWARQEIAGRETDV